MTTFGERLQFLMKRDKMTQQELANRLNVKRGSVSNWVTNRRMPDRELLIGISNIFKVTTDYLLCKTDDIVYKNYVEFLLPDGPVNIFESSPIIPGINQDSDISRDIINRPKTENSQPARVEDNQPIEINNENIIEKNELIKIPVLGVIKAGIPIYAEENIIDYEYIHQEEITMGEEYFYLEVKGDSMINAGIYEGYRVLIKKQNFIENNGDIMALYVNSNEATLKKVYKQENGLILVSENPKYEPMFFNKKDIENGDVGIIGRAVEVKFKL